LQQPPVVRIEKDLSHNRSTADSTNFVGYEFPQDTAWEFPRNKLIFAETLGEGQFGKVLKAYTTGFSANGTNATVAVKMLRDNHTDYDIINLIQEMELMKLIGQHKNIINLLGCCTNNRELLVITEFAPHGCLKNFLIDSWLYPESTDDNIRKGTGQLTHKELVTCCYEIAQGMEYLASKKVINFFLFSLSTLRQPKWYRFRVQILNKSC
jgi:serine/threonine protein kinase